MTTPADAGLLADAERRLAALGVPVLLPEQGRQPLESGPTDGLGRPQATRQGVGHYLRQHPGGFVLLEPPQGMGSVGRGALGVWYVEALAYAPTRAEAEALAFRVWGALCGTTGAAHPTPYRVVMPPTSAEAQAGLTGWRCALAVSYTANLGRIHHD